jgi:DNA-binding transcriptional LysR family regulator
LAELVEEEWIFPVPESPSYNAVEKLFRVVNLELPPHHLNSLSILTNIGILLESEMIALMPRAAAVQFVDAGLLAILDLPTTADFGEVGFSIRADKEVNPACKNFIQCLREATKEIFA